MKPTLQTLHDHHVEQAGIYEAGARMWLAGKAEEKTAWAIELCQRTAEALANKARWHLDAAELVGRSMEMM